METLGQFLKREREFRRVSLEDVERATKVNAPLLDHLEADRLEVIPKGVFLKGFLKSYCQTVGLNFDEVMVRFPEVFPTVKNDKKDDGYAKFGEKKEQNSQVLWIVIVVAAVITLAALLATR